MGRMRPVAAVRQTAPEYVVCAERRSVSSSKPAAGGQRLPLVVYVLALCTFLMITTEFVVAGLLPDIAADVDVDVDMAQAGLLITMFAVGMIVGAPLMSMLTLRVPGAPP